MPRVKVSPQIYTSVLSIRISLEDLVGNLRLKTQDAHHHFQLTNTFLEEINSLTNVDRTVKGQREELE